MEVFMSFVMLILGYIKVRRVLQVYHRDPLVKNTRIFFGMVGLSTLPSYYILIGLFPLNYQFISTD